MKYESESLPRGWTDAALGDLGEWIGGGTPSKSRVDFWENGSIPWISPKDMKTDVVTGAADYITEDAVQDSATQLLPSGAVLFVVRSGILGRTLPVAVTTFPATINQDLKALIPSCLISSQYVMNFVRARENDILEYARKAGTTVASLNVERLKTYPIPIPPIAEQKRILARLREMLARTRTARETLEAVPALLEQFRQSVLAAAFRGDLTDDWRTLCEGCASQQDRIGSRHLRSTESEELPDSWKWMALEELASDLPRAIQSGPFGSQLLHSEFQSTGVLVIGIDNVHAHGFSMGSEHRISLAKYAELERFTARPHDVLVTVMATVGRCCVVPEDLETAIVSKHVYRITVNRSMLEPQYLVYAFQGAPAVLQEIVRNVRGQTRAGINSTILKQLPIPVPPLEEQRELIRRIRAAFEHIDSVQSVVSGAMSDCETAESAILAQAFRGELVPQDPNDEPASVLLERIRAERAAAPPRQRRARGGRRNSKGKG